MCYSQNVSRFDYMPWYRIPHAYRMRSGTGYICFSRLFALPLFLSRYRSFLTASNVGRNSSHHDSLCREVFERISRGSRTMYVKSDVYKKFTCSVSLRIRNGIYFPCIIDNHQVYAFRSRPWAKHASTIHDVTTRTTELSNAPCFPLYGFKDYRLFDTAVW